MTKRVRLRLDRFGKDAVEGTGSSLDALMSTAARYYLGDDDSGRPAWRVPRLARSGAGGNPLEVQIDDPLHAELELEARRQAVTPDLLAEHALLYYLADLDTGRVAARLGDAVNRDAEAE
jgi:hypothetical protein